MHIGSPAQYKTINFYFITYIAKTNAIQALVYVSVHIYVHIYMMLTVSVNIKAQIK